jgi:hypothetical protein
MNNIKLSVQQDDLIINFVDKNYVETRVSSPFGAYYFLIVIMFFKSNFKNFLKFIHIYNLSLFFTSAIFIFVLLKGIYWISPVINAHEIAYKGTFLSIGMLILGNNVKYYQYKNEF